MQTQLTPKCVIKEETEVLSEKPLRNPPSQNQSTREESWSTRITKNPPSLVYLMYLRAPSSYYQRTSRSYVFSSFPDPTIPPDCIHQASPASFGKSPKLLKLQNTLYTLNRCGLCLSTKSPLKV